MKILVPIKKVIDFNVKIRVKSDNSGVETANVKMSMNPFDEIAVEEALRLKEAGEADEIVVVTIGDEKCEDVLRTALAMGADRAVLLVSDVEVQPLGAAKLLSRVVADEMPNLVILGKQAIDDDNNQTGQMLAGLLGWGQGTFASKVELADGKINVTREIDGGANTVCLKLPAVVTTDLRLNEPRYVALPNIMKARSKPLEKKSVTDFGVNLNANIQVLKVEEPVVRAAGVKVVDVDELLSKIRAGG